MITKTRNSILPATHKPMKFYSSLVDLVILIAIISFIFPVEPKSAFGLFLLIVYLIFYYNKVSDICLDEEYIYFYNYLFGYRIKTKDVTLVKLSDKGMFNIMTIKLDGNVFFKYKHVPFSIPAYEKKERKEFIGFISNKLKNIGIDVITKDRYTIEKINKD